MRSGSELCLVVEGGRGRCGEARLLVFGTKVASWTKYGVGCFVRAGIGGPMVCGKRVGWQG